MSKALKNYKDNYLGVKITDDDVVAIELLMEKHKLKNKSELIRLLIEKAFEVEDRVDKQYG